MAGDGQRLVDRRCRILIAHPSDDPKDFKAKVVDVVEIDGGATDDRETVGMHIKFNVKKALKKEPNAGEITISNLSPTRRASLQKKGVRVLLEAGYKDTGVFRIFSGDVRTVDHIRNGADWDTTLKLGDGERAWNYARVTKSFSPNVTIANVVRELGKSLGVDPGNLEAQASKIKGKWDHGATFTGSAARALDQVLRSVGKTWSIQDGQLQILGVDEALSDTVSDITSSSGLVGSPEMGSPSKKTKTAHVKIKSLLIPMKPGMKPHLKSERYDGFVRVVKCEFKGDTSGKDWYTEMEADILK